MNALREQARAQIRGAADCIAARVESGNTIYGLFSSPTATKGSTGNTLLSGEQPKFTVHIDDAALLTERQTKLTISARRYIVNRVYRFPEAYMADAVLGGMA